MPTITTVRDAILAGFATASGPNVRISGHPLGWDADEFKTAGPTGSLAVYLVCQGWQAVPDRKHVNTVTWVAFVISRDIVVADGVRGDAAAALMETLSDNVQTNFYEGCTTAKTHDVRNLTDRELDKALAQLWSLTWTQDVEFTTTRADTETLDDFLRLHTDFGSHEDVAKLLAPDGPLLDETGQPLLDESGEGLRSN